MKIIFVILEWMIFMTVGKKKQLGVGNRQKTAQSAPKLDNFETRFENEIKKQNDTT